MEIFLSFNYIHSPTSPRVFKIKYSIRLKSRHVFPASAEFKLLNQKLWKKNYQDARQQSSYDHFHLTINWWLITTDLFSKIKKKKNGADDVSRYFQKIWFWLMSTTIFVNRNYDWCLFHLCVLQGLNHFVELVFKIKNHF